MANPPRYPFQLPQRWEGLLIGLFAFVIYLSSAPFIGDGRATMLGLFVATLGGATRICYPLFRLMWFWILLVFLCIIHFTLILMFTWKIVDKWTGIQLIPITIADLSLILFVMYLCFSLLYGRPAKLNEDRDDGPNYSDRGDSL